MPHAAMIHDWRAKIATRFPQLPAPAARALALASLGMTQARSGLLDTLLLALAGTTGSTSNALRQRLKGFYKDRTFDPAACFGPLLRWAVGHRRRVVLALDATHIGDRFVALTVSAVVPGGAAPVAWAVIPADQEGSWNDPWARLLGHLAHALGPGRTVLALTDRGLESATLFRAIVAAGFHPMMRVKSAGLFRPRTWGRGWPMGRFARAAGRGWRGQGTAWPASVRLECTLLARRDAGHADAWLVLTDLAPGAARAAWYGMRTWIEAGFRDLKSDGWDLAKTRMTDADRVARWWAAAAVATLWALGAGQRATRLKLPMTRAHAGAGKPAVASAFALGLAWLCEQIGRGRLREVCRIVLPVWPREAEPCDRIDERLWLAG